MTYTKPWKLPIPWPVIPACRTWEENCELKISLGFIMKLYLKQTNKETERMNVWTEPSQRRSEIFLSPRGKSRRSFLLKVAGHGMESKVPGGWGGRKYRGEQSQHTGDRVANYTKINLTLVNFWEARSSHIWSQISQTFPSHEPIKTFFPFGQFGWSSLSLPSGGGLIVM